MGIALEAIYDLSSYSERIQGIGEEKPYLSPYIARKDDSGGWFPDNLVNIIALPPEQPGGEPRYIHLTPEEIARIKELLRAAKEAGETSIRVPGMPDPLPIHELEPVLTGFEKARLEAEKLERSVLDADEPRKPLTRIGLLLKPNVVSVDYLEKRRATLDAQLKTVHCHTD